MKGSFLCGAIDLDVLVTPTGVSVCHCGQCRKMSGFAWSSARMPGDALRTRGHVHWFASNPIARRAMCRDCGSFLFWQGAGEDTVSFALGAIDGPTGSRLEKHIFTAEKGDYYDIADGVRQDP